jgi:phospholipase/lecithinase/hemolysin
MRPVSYIAALVAVFALGFVPLHTAFGGAQFRVVAFGDSLLDAGTYSPFASKAPFYGGVFTTNPGMNFPPGPNFAQDIAKHYGDTLTPAFVGGFGSCLAANGGLDYAQGGSRVTMQPGIDFAPDCAQATTVPVKDQVSSYLAAYGPFTPNQLVLINGGANDVFFQLAAAQTVGTPTALIAALAAVAQSAVDLAEIVETVVVHGAAHVVVMNLPDIGKTPFSLASPDRGKLLTEVSELFDATLAFALQLQKRSFAGKVILIDAFNFVDRIIASPGTFGFRVSHTGTACNLLAQVNIAATTLCTTNPGSLYCTNPSLFGSSLFCSPNTYTVPGADRTFMFADLVHPTTHLNELFALFVEQQIAAKIW